MTITDRLLSRPSVRVALRLTLAAIVVAIVVACGGRAAKPAPAPVVAPAPAPAPPDPSAPIAPADYGTTLASRRQSLTARGQVIGSGDVGYYMDVQEARLRQFGGTSLRLTRSGPSVILELPGPLNFEVGSARLSTGARTALTGVARVLVDYKFTVISVSGHTDDSGDAALNKALSEQRAAAVARFLIAEGVEAERIVVVGYGSRRPAADNSTEVGRETNRRVERRIDPLERVR